MTVSGLALAMSTGGVARAAVPVVSTFLLADLDISAAQFGVSVTVMIAMVAVGVPLFGAMADRFGARKVLLVRALGAGLALVGVALAEEFWHLVLAQGALGFAVSGGVPASNRVVAETVPASFRGLAVGVKQSGATLGVLLAGATIPVIAVAWGWRAAVGAAAAGCLLTLPAIVALVPGATPAVDQRGRVTGSWGEIALQPSTRWLSAHGFLSGVGIAMVFSFLPLYAVQAVGLAPTTGGQILALMSLTAIAARIAWGRISDVSGDIGRDLRRISLLSVLAVSLMILAGYAGPWALWFGAALAGMSMEAWNALAGSGIISAVPTAKAGRASSVVQVAFMAGNAVGPAAFGAAVQAGGSFNAGWGVCLAVFAAASLMRYTPPRNDPSPILEGSEIVERIEDG